MAIAASVTAVPQCASNVRVFGSVARGEDGPESGIGLLVDLDVHKRGLRPLGAIADELSALLGERVDVAPASALAPPVATRRLLRRCHCAAIE